MNYSGLLYDTAGKIFCQLEDILVRIPASDYARKIALLQNASIGQHVRHLLEIFRELNKGYERGVINYELRERDALLEHDPLAAASCLRHIRADLKKTDCPLRFQAFGTDASLDCLDTETNYVRELAYSVDHAIHHMALIRVGLQLAAYEMKDENFGVAFATQQYRKTCAP